MEYTSCLALLLRQSLLIVSIAIWMAVGTVTTHGKSVIAVTTVWTIGLAIAASHVPVFKARLRQWSMTERTRRILALQLKLRRERFQGVLPVMSLAISTGTSILSYERLARL